MYMHFVFNVFSYLTLCFSEEPFQLFDLAARAQPEEGDYVHLQRVPTNLSYIVMNFHGSPGCQIDFRHPSWDRAEDSSFISLGSASKSQLLAWMLLSGTVAS
jgi:hypothetical protein